MRHMIAQEDDMGCGAACVAFVAGITYQQSVNILGREKARTIGFRLKEMVNALDQLGLRYHFKYVKPKVKPLIYDEGVIVFIRRSPRYPYGHYLIRRNGMWADPWINLVLDKELARARSGFRKRLPGKPQWAILPTVE